MFLPDPVGHEATRRRLGTLASSGRMPHALLLTGPDGVGKRTVALRLARALLCEAPSGGEGDVPGRVACGTCASCRMAGAFRHPSLLLVQPAETPLWTRREAALAALYGGGNDDLFGGGGPDAKAVERYRAAVADAVERGFLEPTTLAEGAGRVDRLLPPAERLFKPGAGYDPSVTARKIESLSQKEPEKGGLARDTRRLLSTIYETASSWLPYERTLGIGIVDPRGGVRRYPRTIHDFLAWKSEEGKHRVVLLDSAERLTPPAQNALLKTLEEPPPGTVFLLVTPAASRLLPTTRSRCHEISFGVVGAPAIAELLTAARGLPADEAASLASAARGRPGWAMDADPTLVAEETARLSDFLDALAAGDLYRALTHAGYLCREDDDQRPRRQRGVADALASLVLLLRDRSLAAAGVEAAPAGRGTLPSPDVFLTAVDRVRDAERAVGRNADLRLLVEGLTLELRAVFAGAPRTVESPHAQ